MELEVLNSIYGLKISKINFLKLKFALNTLIICLKFVSAELLNLVRSTNCETFEANLHS